MDEGANTVIDKTIQMLGKRSSGAVMLITGFFAMAGALAVIWLDGRGIWGMWIPLCFLVIPAIHYLAKKVLALEARIARLEERAEDQH